MGERMTVRLVGGGPWGFRLQGGSGMPLTVSKIRRKSRAQHHLMEGDQILSINGILCDSFSYDQAMGVVDAADNSLNIDIIRGGAVDKENRDPSAIIYQPKEVTVKEKPIHTAAAVKTKPTEPATKFSGTPENSGFRPQVQKQSDTTTHIPTTPATKLPPPPAPPKPIVCHAPLDAKLPTWMTDTTSSIPQISTSRSEFTSSFRQTTSSVTESKSVLQEPKPFVASSVPEVRPKEIKDNAEPVPQTITKKQDVPAYASDPVTKTPGVVPSSGPAQLPGKPKSSSLSEAQALPAQVPAPQESVPQISKAPPLPSKTEPVSQDSAARILDLAPELEALAPELAALETEIAAFSSGQSREPTEPGDSERRQMVSIETTSDGQRYHSLTSETSSWSTGPQHKGTAFQQREETRQISNAVDGTASRVQAIKTETKEEKFRISQKSSSAAAQKQLSPDAGVDILSWRPSSPIFSQPIVPPEPVSKSPTPQTLYKVSRASAKDVPVWSPPSGSVPPQQKKKGPPPTYPKPSRKAPQESRPTSAPPRDYDIWDPFSDSELVCQDSSSRAGGKLSTLSTRTSASSGAVSDTEDWHQAYTSEDEMGSTSLFARKKKMFSSSSFYEEPHSIYPTVEEQVELARKIAGSLSNDNNRKSRGANMFFKRVKRSHTWIHEGPEPYSDGGTTDTDAEPTTPDPGAGSYVKVSSGPPKLKLILDPRQLQDLVKLRNSGLNPVEHTAVSPDICLDLVRDLNSPRGKGAALFAKRKQKALEWVVDEENVRQLMAQKTAEFEHLQEESWTPMGPASAVTRTPNVVVQNRLKLIKSPWEAALESPIGSCDAAFIELPPVVSTVASSIIRAAENKARIAPAAATYSEPPFTLQPDVYKPKAPRGWLGSATGNVPSSERNSSPLPLSSEAPSAPFAFGETRTAASSTAPRPLSFHDFNTTARSWSSSLQQGVERNRSFRHVAPPKRF